MTAQRSTTGGAGSDIALRDGRRVHLRPMRPSDQAELLQAFGRLDPDAIRMRFMRAVRQPNVERLQAALASLPERGIGIVATVPAADGFDIAGSAIALIGAEPSVCEFAITVGPAFAGAGLGKALMTALIDAARHRGLREMEGFVLAVNRPMLGLATRLGFAIAGDPEDPSVRICRLALA